MSEDGKRVAFLASPDRVFRDFEEIASYGGRNPRSALVSWPLSLSADGSTLAYVLGDGSGQRVILNGVPGPWWPRIWHPIALSRDGKVFAYKVIDEDETEFIVSSAGRGPAFESVSLPAVSADGSTIAYLADSDEGPRLILNGKPRPVASASGTLVLSENGRRWVRTVLGSRRLEEEGRTWEEPDLDIDHTFFSPDGRKLCRSGRDEDREPVIVVDGVRHPAPGLAGIPVWSFDGSRIYYPAWRDGVLGVGELR